MSANALRNVSIDDLFGPFPAVIKCRWNGWAEPSFAHSVWEQLAAQVNANEDIQTFIHFDGNARQWIVTDWANTPTLEDGKADLSDADDLYVVRLDADEDGLYVHNLGWVWNDYPSDNGEDEDGNPIEPEPTEHAYILQDDDLTHAILALRAAGEHALADRLLSAATL